jgi:hypothetical protein
MLEQENTQRVMDVYAAFGRGVCPLCSGPWQTMSDGSIKAHLTFPGRARIEGSKQSTAESRAPIGRAARSG